MTKNDKPSTTVKPSTLNSNAVKGAKHDGDDAGKAKSTADRASDSDLSDVADAPAARGHANSSRGHVDDIGGEATPVRDPLAVTGEGRRSPTGPVGTNGLGIDEDARRLEASELQRLGEPSAPENGDGTISRWQNDERFAVGRGGHSGVTIDQMRQLVTDALAAEGVDEPGDRANEHVNRFIASLPAAEQAPSQVVSSPVDGTANAVPTSETGIGYPAGLAPTGPKP